MLPQGIRHRDIEDSAVLEAMSNVPREQFVPDSLREYALGDCPLPIGFKQTISQPYIVAFMSQELRIKKGHRILEIGTGSGYQAAILAELGAEVFSVEIIKELAVAASARLQRLGYTRVHVHHGDGNLGWPKEAPFDGILVTAASPRVPAALIEQLKPQGKLIAPLGSPAFQTLTLLLKDEQGNIHSHPLIDVRFVPLRSRVE